MNNAQLEAMVQYLAGRVQALEYTAMLLISKHHDPDSIKKLWAEILAELSDVHADDNKANFNKGVQKTLAKISSALDKADSPSE